MNLVVGGYAQGKTAFACQEFQLEDAKIADGVTASFDELVTSGAVRNYHLFLREAMKRGEDIEALNASLLEKNPNVILVADEIGCGLVPMDAWERDYRDRVGHLLCQVAARADHVYRVFCGIGRVIK